MGSSWSFARSLNAGMVPNFFVAEPLIALICEMLDVVALHMRMCDSGCPFELLAALSNASSMPQYCRFAIMKSIRDLLLFALEWSINRVALN